ncbi:hypothetical protein DL89DRAFT_271640 [Linderina pennispora]|uniref:Vezatin n=1 Tax=Linderina pennispora TaxID=61395 RepID=A0A1Y1VUK1_9FUNG|nr:uncharacterized protein DL89DRAFT_271640 [Linderina pennispora]ORX64957.1 hypothetical protein DL89DRAFT_271640 [Linderina pennispora]
MTELVAFEDSPLGDYLRDIAAGESLIIDSNEAGFTTTGGPDHAKSPIPLSLWTRAQSWLHGNLSLGNSSDKEFEARLCSVLWDSIVRTLANSGHMAVRYTPRTSHKHATDMPSQQLGDLRPRSSRSNDIAKHTVGPLVLGAAFLIRTRSSVRPALMALSAFIAAAVVWSSWHKYSSQIAAARRAEEYIDSLTDMCQSSRVLDVAIQRALRLVQETELVARGFRWASPSSIPGVDARPGRGAIRTAVYLRNAVGEALRESFDAVALAVEQVADQDTLLELSQTREKFTQHTDFSDSGLSLEVLRARFELHFSLRRRWLQRVLDTAEPLSLPTMNSAAALQSGLSGNTLATFAHIRAASEKGVDMIRKVENSAHTSAQIIVCRESIGLDDDGCQELNSGAVNRPSPEATARLFSSLKAELDTLNAQYQAALTVLTCDDCEGPQASSSCRESTTCVIDQHDIPDGARVLGYSGFDLNDLDVPEQTFEADPAIQESRGQSSNGKPQLLDRSERIRLQRQKREGEIEARERRNDIHSMLNELRSAIDERSRK